MNGLLAVGASACCPPALLFLSHVPKKFSRTVAAGRQGDHLRLRRPEPEDGQQHGGDEERHGRGGRRAGRGPHIAAALDLPVKVVGLAALAENMPGRRAYKPGDIITFANRKTVEVVNTDAEGRLVLADALIMAARQKPDMIVELSTLTGAIVTALGDGMAGLMCRNKKLGQALLQAAETTRRTALGAAPARRIPREHHLQGRRPEKRQLQRRLLDQGRAFPERIRRQGPLRPPGHRRAPRS